MKQKEIIKNISKSSRRYWKSSREIANKLGCSSRYVREVRANIYGAMNKETKTEKIKEMFKTMSIYQTEKSLLFLVYQEGLYAI